jgi:hypothetical protein
MFLLVQLKSSLSFTVSTMTWLVCVINDHVYVPYVVSIYRCFPLSSLVARFDTRVTQRVTQMKQELLTLRSNWVHPRFLYRCLSFSSSSTGLNSYLLVSSSFFSLSLYNSWTIWNKANVNLSTIWSDLSFI